MIARLLKWMQRYGAALAVLAILVAVWDLYVRIYDIPPILLPSPARVAQAAWQERYTLTKGFLATGEAALTGLLLSCLLGFCTAILFSQSKILRAAFYPYVVFLQTVPIVAIAPLLITWCGYGFWTVVLVAAVISLFPIVSNVTAGLISIEENLLDLFRLNRATRWQTLVKLRIPHAVSHLILGLRVSTGMAVIGAVVGEFFLGTSGVGHSGLGTFMLVWQNRARTDALIALVIASTLLGLVVLGIVNLLSRWLLRRWTTGGHFENE